MNSLRYARFFILLFSYLGDSWPSWHCEAFVAERYDGAETGVLEGDAGPAVIAVRL